MSLLADLTLLQQVTEAVTQQSVIRELETTRHMVIITTSSCCHFHRKPTRAAVAQVVASDIMVMHIFLIKIQSHLRLQLMRRCIRDNQSMMDC